MSSTQPPYYSSSFGDPTQHPNSSQPVGTQVGTSPEDRVTGPAPHTAGPHKSDLLNKLDPRVDSDMSKEHNSKSSDASAAGGAGTGAAGTHSSRTGPGSKTAGPHGSDMANKADPRVDSDRDNYKTKSTVGPHSSDMANKTDPRVDSDLSNRGTTSTYAAGSGQGTAGPHSSNMANKADPRIDSDMDNCTRHAPGTASSDARTGPATRTAGPHSSDMTNKLDPRVDSDLDNRAQHAPSTTKTGATGSYVGGTSSGYPTGPASGTAGPHNSNITNKADPRVDSDLDNRAKHMPGTTKSGNAHPGTTHDASLADSYNPGPHNSKMMNKMDPRVDTQTGEMTGSHSHGPQFSGDTRSQYEAGATGSSTGAGYASSGVGYQPTPSSGSATSRSAQKGENLGQGVKGTFAGAHGAGESLRGGLNAAVDKTFGHEEGVAKNDAIASQGEREMRSGRFGRNAY
ncbi:hypothetical protein BDV25DRAFT_150882 [Aspergillus avenaceus]|uniref:Cell surface protein n=1 Tax=Aspergillus avenaceus TaxID=36643 RepID=A0A5N6U216_ASPAV|nr:hypothetical protein BDV25DRAFT_150882 [Aspergillus avenaceus]